MKRRLSAVEKCFIVVPLFGLIPLARVAMRQHFFYRLFPHSVLQNSAWVSDGHQFSPNSEFVFGRGYANGNATLSMWEAKTGFRLWHSEPDRDTSWPGFSPDSKLLVNVKSGAISPSGEWVRSADSVVQIYDVQSGQILRTFDKRWINRAFFVDGGRKLWCDGTPSLLLDAATGKTLATTSSQFESYAPYPPADTPLGVLMHTTKIKGVEYKQAEVWDFSVGRRLRSFPSQCWRGFREYAVSRDNRTMFVFGIGDVGTAEAWDIATGKKLLSLPDRRIGIVRFSPDNESILFNEAISPRGAKVEIYKFGVFNIRTNRQKWRVRLDSRDLNKQRFLPDGKRITSGKMGIITFLDARSGEKIQDSPSIAGSSPAFSPNGQQMVIEGDNCLLVLPIPN